jgi:hypothetical protein
MKTLSAGLTFVNISTVCGLLLGIVFRGLGPGTAMFSLIFGGLVAIATYLKTTDPEKLPKNANGPGAATAGRYQSIWLWGLGVFFLMFAARSFLWLLYIDTAELRIQSPNNLGDLALHITYIKHFASGVPLWPDNPIYVFSKLRYPAGIDLFNALLYLVDVDLIRGLVWAGVLASVATFYAFWRWGGGFAIAGFLFNGGVAGFEIFRNFQFQDYQGKNDVAWKSIPLAMFVTQRGLLYAIPAGLLLLWHWRQKFFRSEAVAGQDRQAGPLPFWIELSLYASLPLFHMHTFIALSIVLVFLFLFGDPAMQRHVLTLIASALVPATFFVWLITDHFHASSVLKWYPGWVLHDKNDFAQSFFWLFNFGILIPLLFALLGAVGWSVWKSELRWRSKAPEDFIFLAAATAIFLLVIFVKLAPWEWDNLKVLIWAYFLVLPLLWTRLLANWIMPVRIALCIALFGSGFVSLIGGLKAGGYGFANRAELDGVGAAVRNLPLNARFAAFPVFNHPLLLQGRKVVLGYGGHLWTQGFDYGRENDKLTDLMNGGNWREDARTLRARYIFWGSEEGKNYPASTRPWETTAPKVASGTWGAIYDLQPLQPNAPSTLKPSATATP